MIFFAALRAFLLFSFLKKPFLPSMRFVIFMSFVAFVLIASSYVCIILQAAFDGNPQIDSCLRCV